MKTTYVINITCSKLRSKNQRNNYLKRLNWCITSYRQQCSYSYSSRNQLLGGSILLINQRWVLWTPHIVLHVFYNFLLQSDSMMSNMDNNWAKIRLYLKNHQISITKRSKSAALSCLRHNHPCRSFDVFKLSGYKEYLMGVAHLSES